MAKEKTGFQIFGDTFAQMHESATAFLGVLKGKPITIEHKPEKGFTNKIILLLIAVFAFLGIKKIM